MFIGKYPRVEREEQASRLLVHQIQTRGKHTLTYMPESTTTNHMRACLREDLNPQIFLTFSLKCQPQKKVSPEDMA